MCNVHLNPKNLFQGTIGSARILSNRIGYGPRPAAEDEVEQHFAIMADGTVQFSSFCYNNGIDYLENRAVTQQFSAELVEPLLCSLSDFFREEHDDFYFCDCGDWSLTLTTTENETYHFSGSLCARVPQLRELSDLFRTSLGLPQLFVFDGDSSYDQIQRITLDYRRKNTERSSETAGNPDYLEHIILDRQSETLTFEQTFEAGEQVFRKFYLPGKISSLLNQFNENSFQPRFSQVSQSIELHSSPAGTYILTVSFLQSAPQVLSGAFTAQDLSPDVIALLNGLQRTISDFHAIELLTLTSTTDDPQHF